MRQLICDTETTGLNPRDERLVSIAAIEMVDGELTGAFAHWHLNPGKSSHPRALEVHGLTDEYLATQPAFEAISDQLISFLGTSPLIFHNAPFDMGFIEAALWRILPGYTLINPVRCTYAKAVAARGMGKGRNTLDVLTREYNTLDIRTLTGGKHGALVDCLQLYGVYRALHGAEQVPLLQSLLDHYFSKGFGVHGSLSTQSPGSPAVPSSAKSNPPGVPADVRTVG